MALCVKVKKKDAEKVKREILERGLIDFNYSPTRDENFVYFAVKKRIKGCECVEKKVGRKRGDFGDLRDILKNKLTSEEIGRLVTSYDVIGDIAVLDIPKELERKEKIIAKALLKNQKKIKVVAKRKGAFSGVYRIRNVKIIAGGNRTLTIHGESGCRFYVDVNKVYFSPRLSYERLRISDLIQKNEKILVLFAGVGPYAIVAAKNHPDAKIIAIELNPDAVELMEKNIDLNKVKNVKAVLGDVKEVLKKWEYKKWANRIVMPLPKGAEYFLNEAFDAAADGCVIHFYHFSPSEEAFEEAEEIIKKVAEKKNKKIKIENERVVRPFSAKITQVVIDFTIN